MSDEEYLEEEVVTHTGVGARLKAAREERGLDLIVITDHSNSAGSMDCETGDVEDCPNQGSEFPAQGDAAAHASGSPQVVVGLELSPVESLESTSIPTGHVGCLPRSADTFTGNDEAVTDRPPGSVSGGQGVVWCHEAGGLAVINHPFSIAGWISYDWTTGSYDALEIFNGGGRFDANDAQGVEAWLCDLAQGKATIPLGGSDSHRAGTPTPPLELLDQAVGFPTTWAWSTEGDADGILEAISLGRVIVGDPRGRLDVVAHDDKSAAGPGETLRTGAASVRLEVTATVPVSGINLQVIDIQEADCLADPRWTTGGVPSYSPTVIHQTSLRPEAEEQVSIEVPAGSSIVVRTWPEDSPGVMGDGIILAAPIQVQRD